MYHKWSAGWYFSKPGGQGGRGVALAASAVYLPKKWWCALTIFVLSWWKRLKITGLVIKMFSTIGARQQAREIPRVYFYHLKSRHMSMWISYFKTQWERKLVHIPIGSWGHASPQHRTRANSLFSHTSGRTTMWAWYQRTVWDNGDSESQQI